VIAPLLIIQRVASRGALTSDTIVTGYTDSFHARSREESRGGDRVLQITYSMNSADNSTKNAGQPMDHGVEATIDFNRDHV